MKDYFKATKKVLWQNIFYMYMNKCFHIMKTYLLFILTKDYLLLYNWFYYFVSPQAVKYHA